MQIDPLGPATRASLRSGRCQQRAALADELAVQCAAAHGSAVDRFGGGGESLAFLTVCRGFAVRTGGAGAALELDRQQRRKPQWRNEASVGLHLQSASDCQNITCIKMTRLERSIRIL